MSTFDIASDAPGLLRAEAINITLKFDRTGPSTGRVSWNIPTPAAGCTAGNQAYCGMLITVDTKPAAAGKGPTNGTVYNSDPTADTNLFAGDKLDTAQVIGAFYQDRTTTFFDVTGLKANTPYYVSGFPVDCQLRYFPGGVHAYSTELTNKGTDGTHGTQVLILNSNMTPPGVQPTDSTGLAPGVNYSFSVQVGLVPQPNRPVDPTECMPVKQTFVIDLDGSLGQTFEELAAEINRQFAGLSGALQSPTPPNAGGYYYNTQQKKLFQWDGYTHVELPVIVDTTAPNIVNVGGYWLNPTTNVLQFWNGTVWVPVSVINHATDPTQPTAEASFWFDGTNAYVWNGNTWCQVTIYNQSSDPSLATDPAGGSYWYDNVHGILYKWNAILGMWSTTTAIQYHEDPNALSVGSYWFNEVAGKLFALNVPSPGWNEQLNVAVSEIAPLTPAPGKFWYNPTANELFQRDPLNTTWVQLDVIVFPFDPSQRSFCDLWWNTVTDILSVWNAVGNVWVPVSHFYQQSVDPSVAPVIAEGATWYDPDTGLLYVWENNCFVLASVVTWPTDPTLGFFPGTVWHDTTLNKYYVWDLGAWVEIDPVASINDPRTLPAGTFWMNPSTGSLQMWTGASWMTVMYSTAPLVPAKGTLWLDLTTSTLKTWNGTAWVAADPLVQVEIDCNGNFLFTDNSVGSLSYIGLTDISLFNSLSIRTTIHNPNPGTDGASDQPTYSEVGIGTDGTDNARNALINEIRYELGYPVIDVELTKEQMDYAINRAIGVLRERSGVAYKRSFFFMMIKANEQRYFLTNKINGMNKIVDVQGVYRVTSAFLASAHGSGVYGQIMLQHLYNMGTFDLLSYHLMADYTKLMEILFASRVTFNWNEQTREIWLHNTFSQSERRVLIEATVERTEQDMMTDRYARSWIRRYAAATSRIMLAEIRGKFSSLPGASGSVTLNADALRTTGQAEIEACLADIDSYIIDKPEEYGMGTQFTFG